MAWRAPLVLVLCCLSPFHDAPAQEAGRRLLSLEEAERLALRHSPVLGVAEAEVALSRAKRTRAERAGILPRANLRNVWGPIPRARGEFTETGVLVSPDTSTGLSDLRWFTEVELSLTQPILTFGRLSGASRAAGHGVEAAEAGVEAAEADVRLRVRKAYWGLVLGYELLRVIEGLQEDAREAETRLNELFDEGSESVSQVDLFKFEVFRYQLDKSHREALGRLELGRAGLRTAIGLDDGEGVDVQTRVLEPAETTLDSLEAYVAIALRTRPELEQLRAGIAARSSLIDAERGSYLPQLFAAAEFTLNRAPSRFDPNNPFVYNPTNFFRPGVIVGLNWDINFLHTGDRVRLAEAELAKVADGLDPLTDAIRLEVHGAYLKVREAERNIEQSRRALKASENWLRSTVQTFDLGIGEIKDVIDAFQANAAMRREHLQTIFEYNSALAELSKAVGQDLYPRAAGGGPAEPGEERE